MHEQRQIGRATLTLADDHFLANNLLTPFHSNRWNAGYVMGWLITLYEKQRVSPAPSKRGAEQQEVLR